MLISVIGTMGVGKSTVLDLLFRTGNLRLKLFYEPLPETDNFILEYFYANPKKWVFTMQSLMLGLHLDIQRRALEFSRNGYISVMDSSMYCGKAYVDTQYQDGMMNDIEYKAYNKLYSIAASMIEKPDIIFMLDTSFENIASRVRERNRSCESNADLSYLKNLHDNYKKLAHRMEGDFNVIYINSSKEKEQVVEEILSLIEKFEHKR